ncbi:MAG: serine/threonine protein kinase [Candidatus Sericytochromatia bacterium]
MTGWPLRSGTLLLERYVLDTCLAEGAARQIWHAHDRETGAAYVLKVLHFQQVSDWGMLQQLEREALLLQALSHPRLPRCEGLLELPDGIFCLVQQALPGESLQTQIQQRGPLGEAECVSLAVQALLLLESLHRLQPALIHCDIKPSNLLWDAEQRLRLIDFGSAQSGGEAVLSESLSGTVGYMPPEQMAGRPVPASDLYALGITLVVLLSAQRPEDFPDGRLDLYALLKGLSPPLLNWLEVLIHPDPALRFQDAREALEALPGAKAVPPERLPPPVIQRASHVGESQMSLPARPLGCDELGCWGGRYRPLKALSQQGGASTWRGEDTVTGDTVILKRLDLQQVEHVKELELLEREQQVLQELAHPRLPQVRALIQEERAWLLVLSYLPGQTLLERLETGWRASEEEIWELGRQTLTILQTLHAQGLLHRNLQPANLLWDDTHTLYLLDFGAVGQAFRAQGSGGSTLLGGMGYAAPEQWLGRAEPASDLYALGLSLLHLISGSSPAQLGWEGQSAMVAGASAPLFRWLKQLTQLELNKRLPSAERALQALEQQRQLSRDLHKVQQQQNPQQQRQALESLREREALYHGLERVEQDGLAHLQALGVPLPPPRLHVGNEALPLSLIIPFDRPVNQPRLRRRLRQWQLPLSALSGLSLLLMLMHVTLPAFALTGLLLFAYPLSWRYSGAERLGNAEFWWESGGLRFQQHWPARWHAYLWFWRPLWRRQEVFLPWDEITGLSLQNLGQLPLEGGADYRLLVQSRTGIQPWGPVFFLKDSERDWLLTALPLLLQAER